jgi:hypothetical protein
MKYHQFAEKKTGNLAPAHLIKQSMWSVLIPAPVTSPSSVPSLSAYPGLFHFTWLLGIVLLYFHHRFIIMQLVDSKVHGCFILSICLLTIFIFNSSAQ